MKAFKKLTWVAGIILIFIACDHGPRVPEADLLVQVEGYLSGNVREGIRVQVYLTREDAEDQIGAITPPLWTDNFGEVEIFGLDTNRRYFVRADARAAKTIRRSKRLDVGINMCRIRIL
ncbi:MAG: hypothetical protein AAGF85_02265 [Bacteroidota bacterium]